MARRQTVTRSFRPSIGYYKIVSAASGKLMDVPGNSVLAGTQVCQWDDSGNTNQQWSLVWIP